MKTLVASIAIVLAPSGWQEDKMRSGIIHHLYYSKAADTFIERADRTDFVAGDGVIIGDSRVTLIPEGQYPPDPGPWPYYLQFKNGVPEIFAGVMQINEITIIEGHGPSGWVIKDAGPAKLIVVPSDVAEGDVNFIILYLDPELVAQGHPRSADSPALLDFVSIPTFRVVKAQESQPPPGAPEPPRRRPESLEERVTVIENFLQRKFGFP